MEPIKLLNDHFNKQIDAVLVSRPKKIEVKYEPDVAKYELFPEMDKVLGYTGKHLYYRPF